MRKQQTQTIISPTPSSLASPSPPRQANTTTVIIVEDSPLLENKPLLHGEEEEKSPQNKAGELPAEDSKLFGTWKASSIWRLGFALFALGSVLNFIAFGFAAQSLLACLGSVQFLTNVVFSALVFRFTINRQTLVATVLIVVGNIIIVLFAPKTSQELSTGQLMALFGEQTFLWYLFSILSASALFQLLYVSLERTDQMPCGIQLTDALLGRICGVAYALASGMLGTLSVVLAKSCSELLRTTLAGNNQLVNPFTYAVLVAWLVAMGFWLTRMNRALVLFDGVFIIPVLQVVWILFSVTAGGIYFKEFNSFTPLNAGVFSLGILIILVGVFLLASDQSVNKSAPVEGSLRVSRDVTEWLMDMSYDSIPSVYPPMSAMRASNSLSRRSAPAQFGASGELDRSAESLQARTTSNF